MVKERRTGSPGWLQSSALVKSIQLLTTSVLAKIWWSLCYRLAPRLMFELSMMAFVLIQWHPRQLLVPIQIRNRWQFKSKLMAILLRHLGRSRSSAVVWDKLTPTYQAVATRLQTLIKHHSSGVLLRGSINSSSLTRMAMEFAAVSLCTTVASLLFITSSSALSPLPILVHLYSSRLWSRFIPGHLWRQRCISGPRGRLWIQLYRHLRSV